MRLREMPRVRRAIHLSSALCLAAIVPVAGSTEQPETRWYARLPWPGPAPRIALAPDATRVLETVTLERTGRFFLVVPDGQPVRDGDVLRVRATADGTRVLVNGRVVARLDAGAEWTVTPWRKALTVRASSPVEVTILRRSGT